MNMGREFITNTYETNVIDKQTGEIMQTTQRKTYTTKSPVEKFYMVFFEHIAPVYDLSRSYQNLLTWLCSNAEFNTGKVLLPTGVRKQCCDDLGISNNTLSNYLKKLKDKKLIEGEGGEFIINPSIFWKGDTKSRAELMQDEQIKITFEIK